MTPHDWDKISDNYDTQIMSPLDERVDNPLYAELKKVRDKKNKMVLEVGCGLGRLSPLYAKRFKLAVCTDFSEKMIENARARNNLPNVTFQIKNTVNLRSLHNKFNVAVSVNSIIMPSIIDVDKALKQVYRCLLKKGTFLGIFPSLDSDIYRASLTFDREYRSSRNESEAVKDTRHIISSSSYDFLLGFYRNRGRQNHFFKSDLEFRLQKAGFTNIQFKKVKYPWSMTPDKFPGKEPLWDWFVKADS